MYILYGIYIQYHLWESYGETSGTQEGEAAEILAEQKAVERRGWCWKMVGLGVQQPSDTKKAKPAWKLFG